MLGAMNRQEALRLYLLEVAKDLLRRGIIESRQGKNVIDMLRQHPSEMFASIVRDLKEAGFSVGQEIVGGAISGFMSAIFSHASGRRGG